MRNFSSNQFSYEVKAAVGRSGSDLILTRLETGETKTFYQASGLHVSADGTNCHMESMTDSLLLQFFEKKGGKSKKEKKREQSED